MDPWITLISAITPLGIALIGGTFSLLATRIASKNGKAILEEKAEKERMASKIIELEKERDDLKQKIKELKSESEAQTGRFEAEIKRLEEKYQAVVNQLDLCNREKLRLTSELLNSMRKDEK